MHATRLFRQYIKSDILSSDEKLRLAVVDLLVALMPELKLLKCDNNFTKGVLKGGSQQSKVY